jgi:hypothetical protein
MRHFARAALVMVFSGAAMWAIADDAPLATQDLATTIARGLDFLGKDAIAWREEHHCASCHHASLVVWAMRESKRAGHKVDEPLLAELAKWLAESGDGKTGVPRPEGIPKALNEKAVSFAMALVADPQPDELATAGLKRLLGTVTGDQTENGSWASWPETRQPIFGNSDERATAAATWVLASALKFDRSSELVAARDRGLGWLEKTKSDDESQSTALRVILWRQLGRSADEWQPLAERIVARQNPDGGWNQAPDMQSDAWATGQALYAVAGWDVAGTAIERGRAFLASTQRQDGSWPMTSRPTKPGGTGSTSLIPITGAGSAWAVAGLARSGSP